MSEGPPDPKVMIQLYRGELARTVDYRIRLDTTTNWAFAGVLAVVTFMLGAPEVSHSVVVLPAVLCLVFAMLESRRLQDMELSRSRVRLLERGFFRHHLGQPPLHEWEQRLADSLERPTAPITIVEALAVRMRRNYVWVFLTLYGSWWFKLGLDGRPLVEAAAFGPFPGRVSIVLMTGMVVPPILLAMRAKPLLPG
jgi:uncharacterized membrane protein